MGYRGILASSLMIDFPVHATEYTVTVHGRELKVVPCESCSTEYAYLLDRQGTGAGTSLYMLNDESAKANAVSGAEEALKAYLENDFDPVPCPVCGHYQRYMFSKLYESQFHGTEVVRFVLLALGLFDAVATLYWAVTYLLQPSEHALGRMVATGALLAVLSTGFVGLVALERAKARRFDPNLEDQQARIARGRSRAVTRAELAARQQRDRDTDGGIRKNKKR